MAITGLFLTALFAIIGLGEILRRVVGLRAEVSRRVVHMLTGLAVAVAVPAFPEPLPLYILAVAFVAVNLISVRKRWFPGMHGIRRKSIGTVTFPLALIFALITCWTLDPERTYIIQIAFVVLAISDPLAASVGESLRRPGRFRIGPNEKSIAGSTAFFLSSWLLVGLGISVLGDGVLSQGEVVLAAAMVAAVASAAEALATRGWDNFFVVVAVIAPLVWLEQFPYVPSVLVAAAAIAAVFGVLAHSMRFLTLDGALAAGAFAYFVIAFGGWAWVVPTFTFFVLSSLLSRAGRSRKEGAAALAEKGSTRDAGQVYANGGVAWALVLVYVFFPGEHILYWAFAAALAAAAADTWATEIGTLVRGKTRLIWSGREVAPGTSGGVSAAGTIGALAGAAVVFGSLIPFAGEEILGVGVGLAALIVIGGGFVASAVDSVLGATVQAVYLDPVTGELTERSITQPGVAPSRGIRVITNDRVNLICTIVGASVPLIVLALR